MMTMNRKKRPVTTMTVKLNIQTVERAVQARGARYYRVIGATVVEGNLIQTLELDNGEKMIAVFRSYGNHDEHVTMEDWAE